jgi:hypothetical protein
VNNLKRFTVCKLIRHDWVRRLYLASGEDTGHFIRCARCGKEDHKGGPGRDLRSPFNIWGGLN